MIDKDTFQSAIFALKENMEFEDKLNKLLDANYFTELADTVINLLNKSMCLDDTFDTISWWVYELDFGEKGDDCITVDGKCISLKSSSELYDYLIEYEVVNDDKERCLKEFKIIEDAE